MLPLAFLLTRLPYLGSRPFFVDEATYAQMGWVISQEPSRLWLPLTDGKTPLHLWSAALAWPVLEALGVSDAATVVRLVSVFWGAWALVGLLLLVRRFTGELGALLAGLWWLSLPFPLLHDRLGITDGMMTAAAIWLALLASQASRAAHLGPAWYAALAAGAYGCYLVKPQAVLLLPVALLPALLRGWSTPKAGQRAAHLGGALLIAAAVLLGVRLTAGLNPAVELERGVDSILHKTAFYLEWDAPLSTRLALLAENAGHTASVLLAYAGWPVLLAGLVGLALGCAAGQREMLLAAAWLAGSTAPLWAVLVLWYPRYYCLAVPPLLCGAVYLAGRLPRRLSAEGWLGVLLALSLTQTARLDWDLITAPLRTRYVEKDRFQFVTGQTSGRGMEQVTEWVLARAAEGNVTIIVDTYLGHPGDSLALATRHQPRVRLVHAWWFNEAPLYWPDMEQPLKTKYERRPSGVLRAEELHGKYILTNDVAYPEATVRLRHPGLVEVARFQPQGIRQFCYIVWQIPGPELTGPPFSHAEGAEGQRNAEE